MNASTNAQSIGLAGTAGTLEPAVSKTRGRFRKALKLTGITLVGLCVLAFL